MSEIYIDIAPHHPIDIFGLEEERLNSIRRHFPQLNIVLRGNLLKVMGDDARLKDFEDKIKLLLFHFEHFNRLSDSDIENILEEDGKKASTEEMQRQAEAGGGYILAGANGKIIRALTENQKKLTEAVADRDLVFAVGPAGSGKTYTAVALAVKALKEKEVKRIILTRPAVEAGEKLGFLPGDLQNKVDPYLRPLYDALFEMFGQESFARLSEHGAIEVAPLAYMRGRTLDDSFIILDEAQNTTREQMKMFLTRLGFNSKMVITGDITQIDLPEAKKSGLIEALKVLRDVEDIAQNRFTEKDVVRHKLVQDIVKAYDEYQGSAKTGKGTWKS